MPAHQTIDYLELPAADFDAVEAFHASAFGWSFTDPGSSSGSGAALATRGLQR